MWFGVGEQSIPQTAKATGALPIHTAIVTHADVDHFSGLLDAARATGVRRVLVPDSLLRQAEAQPDDAAAALLAGLAQRDIELRTVAAGDAIELGTGVRGVFLHPATGFVSTRDNEGSLVLLIEVETIAGPRHVLMTGDLEGPAIEMLRRALADRGWPEVSAMEAPHHGAAHPAAIALVRELDPAVVVQSTGPRRVDDPRWETGRAGRVWLTTARDGAATVTIHADGSVRARAWGEP
jgi:competence protein ComEC